MRQVEQDIVQAARFGVSFHSGTSSSYKPYATGYRDNLTFDKNTFSYKLWGSEIAKGNTDSKEITVSDCGYRTHTTASRLNALFAALDIPMTVMFRQGYTYWCKDGEIYTTSSFSFIHAGEYDVTIV